MEGEGKVETVIREEDWTISVGERCCLPLIVVSSRAPYDVVDSACSLRSLHAGRHREATVPSVQPYQWIATHFFVERFWFEPVFHAPSRASQRKERYEPVEKLCFRRVYARVFSSSMFGTPGPCSTPRQGGGETCPAAASTGLGAVGAQVAGNKFGLFGSQYV